MSSEIATNANLKKWDSDFPLSRKKVSVSDTLSSSSTSTSTSTSTSSNSTVGSLYACPVCNFNPCKSVLICSGLLQQSRSLSKPDPFLTTLQNMKGQLPITQQAILDIIMPDITDSLMANASLDMTIVHSTLNLKAADRPLSMVMDSKLSDANVGMKIKVFSDSEKSDGNVALRVEEVVTWKCKQKALPHWLCLILEWCWTRACSENSLVTTTFHLESQTWEAIFVPKTHTLVTDGRDHIGMGVFKRGKSACKYYYSDTFPAGETNGRNNMTDRDTEHRKYDAKYDAVKFRSIERMSTLERKILEENVSVKWSGLPFELSSNRDALIKVVVVQESSDEKTVPVPVPPLVSLVKSRKKSLYVNKTSTLYIPVHNNDLTSIAVRGLMPFPLQSAINGFYRIWNTERITKYVMASRSLEGRGIEPLPMTCFHGSSVSKILNIGASAHGGGGFRPEFSNAGHAAYGRGTYTGFDPVRCTEWMGYGGRTGTRNLYQLRGYWDLLALQLAPHIKKSNVSQKLMSIWNPLLPGLARSSLDDVIKNPLYASCNIDFKDAVVLEEIQTLLDLIRTLADYGHVTQGYDPIGSSGLNFTGYYEGCKSYIKSDIDSRSNKTYGAGVLAVCDILLGKAQQGSNDKIHTEHYMNRIDALCTTFVDEVNPSTATLAVIPHRSEDHILLTNILIFDNRI